VQEQVKKVLVTKGIPISVVTHVPLTGDVREDPIATTTTNSTFMNANVDNIHRLCQHNEEKEENIKELEQNFSNSGLMKEAFKVSRLVKKRSEVRYKNPSYTCMLTWISFKKKMQ
jgi:hypothetical protein